MSTEAKKVEAPKPEKKIKEDPLSNFIDFNRKVTFFIEKFNVPNKYDPYLLKNSLDECIKEVSALSTTQFYY